MVAIDTFFTFVLNRCECSASRSVCFALPPECVGQETVVSVLGMELRSASHYTDCSHASRNTNVVRGKVGLFSSVGDCCSSVRRSTPMAGGGGGRL